MFMTVSLLILAYLLSGVLYTLVTIRRESTYSAEDYVRYYLPSIIFWIFPFIFRELLEWIGEYNPFALFRKFLRWYLLTYNQELVASRLKNPKADK